MTQEKERIYYLDRKDWSINEVNNIRPFYEESMDAHERITYMIELGGLRSIPIASGTETQWATEHNLIEGIDFYVVKERPEPNIEEVAYPINPIFTLEEMLQAFDAGFECHKTFPDVKVGIRKLFFKTLKVTLPESDLPF